MSDAEEPQPQLSQPQQVEVEEEEEDAGEVEGSKASPSNSSPDDSNTPADGEGETSRPKSADVPPEETQVGEGDGEVGHASDDRVEDVEGVDPIQADLPPQISESHEDGGRGKGDDVMENRQEEEGAETAEGMDNDSNSVTANNAGNEDDHDDHDDTTAREADTEAHNGESPLDPLEVGDDSAAIATDDKSSDAEAQDAAQEPNATTTSSAEVGTDSTTDTLAEDEQREAHERVADDARDARDARDGVDNVEASNEAESNGVTEGSADKEANNAAEDMRVNAGLKTGQSRQQIVKVTLDNGEEKIYNITVVNKTYKKPFLGGFRNKHTETVYHNASTQTPKGIKLKKVEVFERTTQTKDLRTHPKFATQTAVDAATQMTKAGVFVTSRDDVVLVAGKYETAEEFWAKRVNAIIVIQKYFRRWKAKKVVEGLRWAKKQYELWEEDKLRRRAELEEEAERLDLERRLNPRTAEDFDLLYASLEQWHTEQTRKIALLPQSEQKAARMALLKEQTGYLNSINQLKLIADVDNKDKRIERFLNKATGGDTVVDKEYGIKVRVEHPDNKRAQQLRTVYDAIKVQGLQIDERLDALFSLKAVVGEFSTPLAKEILDLVQREADLLSRRVKSSNMEGLRKRILNLFVQFMEDPQYNPIAKKLLKVHKDKEYFRKNVILSFGSKSFETKDSFEVSPLMTNGLGKAKAALKAENRAVRREDLSLYRKLLDSIRHAEKKYNDNSQCVFLLTVRDLQYLVDTIWGRKSAISEIDDLRTLALCRWDQSKELSPWNCILLELDEVEAHLLLPTPESGYDAMFCSRIVQRHLRAKQHFSTLRAHLAKARKQGARGDARRMTQTMDNRSSLSTADHQ